MERSKFTEEKYYVGVGPGEVIPQNQDGSLDYKLTKPAEVELKEEINIKGIEMIIESMEENPDGTFSIKAKRK